ncbi:MAG: hypothetical protein J7J98_07150 [candidate division Zixibacteria bacterium]|nr:hypothetical protein [candidate division Zixibacteria bacterium]
MRVRKLSILIALIVITLSTVSVLAQGPETFEQACAISIRSQRPILLEFYRDGCESCELAARETESETTVIKALQRVVHLPLNVIEGEGIALAEKYRPGIYSPVFILINAEGDVISRWTGYTGANRFIRSLNTALSDMTTLDERIARCKAHPKALDVQFLAKYYYDTQEFVKARDYYRQLHTLNSPTLDLRYQVFTATAEAVWNNQLSFDELLWAADDLIDNPATNKQHFGRMAQIVTKVARRTGDTGRIKKYLTAGIKSTATLSDDAGVASHRDLLTDYALYVLVDTAEAVSVKQRALGDSWETDPARYFQYAEWCFQRGINLEEAELYVRTATNKASEGKFKAKHLRLLAKICHALGKTDEAITLGEQAMEQDPSASYFLSKLDKWREN